jgi:hypothetical protein
MQTRQVRLLGWTKSFLMLASVAASLAVATPAYAEWFFDLYLGGAFTEKHDIEARSDGGTVTTLDVNRRLVRRRHARRLLVSVRDRSGQFWRGARPVTLQTEHRSANAGRVLERVRQRCVRRPGSVRLDSWDRRVDPLPSPEEP